MTSTAIALEQQLRSEFDVKLMCDLGLVSNSPNALFKLLNDAYQLSYEPNQRIIFYTTQDLSDEFIKHLYSTANFIDISNWFILICGPVKLKQSIIAGCDRFSHDPVPFQFHQVDLDQSLPIGNQFTLPETMCSVPWVNLEIKSNGDITPCCMTKGIALGNIKDTTMEQAFRSPAMKQLRSDLLAGNNPIECDGCWKVEKKNLTSIRMHNIKRMKKDLLTKYLDDPKLSTIDIKFNNTCNFKCRICSADSSSAFALEQQKFTGSRLIVQNNWGESKDFVDQVIFHLPAIHNIDMYGGEPFLIKKFEKVLQLAVENNYAKNIRLHYNSNGSIWPKHLLPYWPSFKLVDIHFSIDAIGKQFELERGGKWSDVESNILQLKNLGLPNLSISVMPTIGSMNVYYIDQVYDWATKHGFSIFVSHARGRGFELQDLNQEAKDLIIEKFKDHPWDEIQQIVKIIQEIPDNDGEQFRSRIKWFDRVRGENFSESHAEIATAMKYV